MNILYTCMASGWGGLEQYPLRMALELRKKNIQVFILTLENSKLHEECLKNKVKVYGLPCFQKVSFKGISFIKKIILENDIKLIHSHKNGEIFNLFFALRNFPHIPLLMTFHMGVPSKNDFIHKFFYKRVSHIFAMTHLHRERMKKNIPLSSSLISTLYFGISLEDFEKAQKSSIREEFSIPQEALLYIAVGNLSLGKGIDDLWQASKEFLKEHQNTYVLWVGDDKFTPNPHAIEEYQQRALHEGLKERFLLAGPRTNVPSLLKSSDVFVLPAHHEAFGMVYIEAMAANLPLIACRSGGPSEILKHQENCILITPKNKEELKKAMESYLNQELREKHTYYSKEYVKRFSMENHVSELLKQYEDCLKKIS